MNPPALVMGCNNTHPLEGFAEEAALQSLAWAAHVVAPGGVGATNPIHGSPTKFQTASGDGVGDTNPTQGVQLNGEGHLKRSKKHKDDWLRIKGEKWLVFKDGRRRQLRDAKLSK